MLLVTLFNINIKLLTEEVVNDIFVYIIYFQVVEVVNADALVIKINPGDFRRINLASIRPPRLGPFGDDQPKNVSLSNNSNVKVYP